MKCESYAADYTDVYAAARMGRTREMVRQMLGDRLQISEAVFNEAYDLGLARRNAYIEEKAAAQETTTEKAKQEHGGKIQAREGSVRVEDITEESAEGDTIERNSIDPTFEAEYDSWDKKDPRVVFKIGTTSKALKSLGVADKTISWDSSKIVKIKAKHSEMTDDIIKQVPNILENPIVVMQSKQNQSRMTMFGEVYVGSKPILAVLELHPTRKGGIQLDELKIASAYGKDNAQAFINSSTILYKDSNKKRVGIWEKRTGLQLPVGSTNANSNNNVPQSGTVVNSQSMQAEEKYSTATPEQKKKGDVRVEGDVKIASPQQLAIKKFADMLAEMTGIDIVLYSNAKKGKMAGKYGLYRHFKDGSRDEIWINLNAGSRGGRLIRATMAHELTHFMAEHNPREYEIYKNFLFDQIGAQRANELVQKHMERGETQDVAIEEVVAELSENMLDNGTAIRKLAETDLATAEKIKAWIDNFLQKFLDAFEKATGRHTELLNEAKMDLEQMQKLFDQTLAKAVENYNAGVKKGDHSAQTEEKYSSAENSYSYESLVEKPDMEIATLSKIEDDEMNSYTEDHGLFTKEMRYIAELKDNKMNTANSVYLHCDDVNKDILIGRDSYRHGAARLDKTYVAVCKELPMILKNAIAVNALTARHETNGSVVLLGMAENSTDYVCVRMIVNEKQWKLVDYDILYSIRKESIKKEDVGVKPPDYLPKKGSATSSKISIRKMLEIVKDKKLANSVLSVDVIQNLEAERINDENITPDLLYSTAVLTEREILSDTFAQLAQTSAEKESISKYREAVGNIEKYEARLAEVNREIKEKSFASQSGDGSMIERKSRPMGGEKERGILPLCNIEKFIASRCLLDIFRVAAAANRLPSSAPGSGRCRDPRGNRREESPISSPNKKAPRWGAFLFGGERGI